MIDLETLKKQDKLTISDTGLIFVLPLGPNHYVTYPIKDLAGCLMLTKDQYVGLKNNYYRIKSDLTGLEINR